MKNRVLTIIALGLPIIISMILTSDIMAIVLFVFFFVCCIQLPGLLFADLLGIKISSNNVMILISFFIGFFVLIIEYIVFSSVNASLLLLLVNIVLSCLFAYRNFKIKSISFLNKELSILILCYYLCSCLYTQLPYLRLEKLKYLKIDHDYLWHMGNVSAMSNGLPFNDFRVEGVSFYYHYFSDLMLAICKNIFSISSYDLILFCTPLLSVYLLGLAFYCLMERWGKYRFILSLSPLLIGFASTSLLIMNSNEHVSLFSEHILSNINGVAFAIPAAIAFFMFFTFVVDKDSFSLSDIIGVCVLSVISTGFKGPFAVVIISSFFVSLLLLTFIDLKEIKKRIIMCSCSFVSFLLTYYIVIVGISNMAVESNNNRKVAISLVGTIQRSNIIQKIPGSLRFDNIIYFLIAGSIMIAGMFSIVLLIGIVKDIRTLLIKTNTMDLRRLMCISIILIGFGGFWIVSQDGYSQMYFLLIILPFMLYYSYDTFFTSKGVLKIIISCSIGLSFVLGAHTFISNTIIDHAKIGTEIRSRCRNIIDKNAKNVVTKNEINGLLWLKQNTQKDSLVFADRTNLLGDKSNAVYDSRFFYYSAISERQLFIEGFSYSSISVNLIAKQLKENDTVYSCKNKTKLSDKKHKYIIFSKRIYNYSNEKMKIGEKCFCNDDIMIRCIE